jgi:hypothetical protein
MNKHFTETSKQLATEKAEADAALADLERRRAQTSEFVPSKGGELNPFDALYVELQQKRADCRRKEKETMLLYQRYKQKFKVKGGSGTSKLSIESPQKRTPLKEDNEDKILEENEDEILEENEDEILEEEMPQQSTPQKGELSPVSEATTPMVAAPPPADPPGKLQSLDETVESLPESASKIHYSKFYEKKLAERSLSSDHDNTEKPVDLSPMPDAPDEQVQEQLECTARILSSPINAASVIIDCDDTVPEPMTPCEEVEDPVLQLVDKENSDERNGKQLFVSESERRIDIGNKQFNDSVTSESVSENRPTIEVTTEIPTAPTSASEDSDDDQRSVISGLTTVNSHFTRQISEQLESEMEFFIKNETEAIQKLLDAEEANTYIGSSFTPTSNSAASVSCDHSVRASIKAEQMAEDMKKMLEDFEKDDLSVASGIKSETADTANDEQSGSKAGSKSSQYPRKYKSPNPDEEWMVYWDEKYEREYYHETTFNKTQWEPPLMKLGNNTSKADDFTPDADEKIATTPRGTLSRRSSRSNLYKKKLRKKRARRALAAGVVFVSLLMSTIHWQVNHSQKSYPDAMKASYSSLKDTIEYTFTNRSAEEQAAAELEARLKQEKEEKEAAIAQKFREEKARKQREQYAAQKAKEEAEALRKKMAVEEERKRMLAEEKKRAEEEAATRRQREEERLKKLAAAEKEASRRPWGCNLPLAYTVHRRCRRLAKTNALYSEENILNSFLQ